MTRLFERPEKVLAANPGEKYCADCLAQAAGFTLEEERLSLAKLIRADASKTTGLVIETGSCGVCGRTELIVRLARSGTAK